MGNSSSLIKKNKLLRTQQHIQTYINTPLLLECCVLPFLHVLDVFRLSCVNKVYNKKAISIFSLRQLYYTVHYDARWCIPQNVRDNGQIINYIKKRLIQYCITNYTNVEIITMEYEKKYRVIKNTSVAHIIDEITNTLYTVFDFLIKKGVPTTKINGELFGLTNSFNELYLTKLKKNISSQNTDVVLRLAVVLKKINKIQPPTMPYNIILVLEPLSSYQILVDLLAGFASDIEYSGHELKQFLKITFLCVGRNKFLRHACGYLIMTYGLDISFIDSKHKLLNDNVEKELNKCNKNNEELSSFQKLCKPVC